MINEHSELADALGATPEPRQKYPPHTVPYLNDQYTYGDRQNELELIDNLLSHRLASVRAELAMIREINAKQTYPNIVFEDAKSKVG